MLIREAELDDAENLIKLIKQVEAESPFMLMEAGERKTSPEDQRRILERMKRESHSAIFVAEQDGRLVGYLIAIGGNANKIKHRAYLVIGILEEFRGQGIGTALFQHLEEWAASHYIERLELTVVTDNNAGVALYKKRGFEIEGTKRKSIKMNGQYYDEYYMAKLL